MLRRLLNLEQIAALIGACLLMLGSGCALSTPRHPAPVLAPKELDKAVLPPYRIEPPDVLVISAVHLAPPPSYPLRAGDVLYVQVPLAFVYTFAPIDGEYPVGPGGLINLGVHYGSVNVNGLTVDQAREAIKRHLETQIKREDMVEISLSVALAGTAGLQQVEGEHLVGPDGTVTLGMYGSVPVVGMTLAEAKFSIEQFLRQYFENPQVSVNVLGYNSKVYYVVTEGAGLGDSVVRLPITGNETVLDGLAKVNEGSTNQISIPQVASKRIWVARPGRNQFGKQQILPVDYAAITKRGDFTTNYQLLPGDRLFIEEDGLVALDTSLGKLFAPMERMMGFSLLGVGTVTRFSGKVLAGGGTRGSFGTGGSFTGGIF